MKNSRRLIGHNHVGGDKEGTKLIESQRRRQLESAVRAEEKAKEPEAGPHKLAGQPLGVWTHLEEHYTAGASVLIINAKTTPRAPLCGKPLWTHSSEEMIRCREILQIPSDLHPLHFP